MRASRKEKLFVGRDQEVAEFRQLLKKDQASLVTCQGRRRIGKSTFVQHCSQYADHFLSFSGLPPRRDITRQHQLEEFARRLREQTEAPELSLHDWAQAFQLLDSQLPRQGRAVLLLDEISWMAYGDADFSGHLKNAWDERFSRRRGLIVVLCGSVSSWIEENILNSTGFVGRCSWHYHLRPLALPYCARFWRHRSSRTPVAEKLRILSVTGGVPRYLEEIDPSQDAQQNIERLCFNSSGLLFREFDQIFHDIFSRKATTYRNIVRALVDGPRSVGEIGRVLGRAKGGTLSDALKDLEQAGFLTKEVPFDPSTGADRSRGARFRLHDNYVRFYLKYVEPVRGRIEKGLYRARRLSTLTAWDAIMGLQVENLVQHSLPSVLAQLGLANVPVLNAGPYFRRPTRRHPGVQVDLLIRTQSTIYALEIKLRRKIPTRVIAEMRSKCDRLQLSPHVGLRTGLLYEGSLAAEIPDSDYFDYLIPLGALLA